MISDIVFSRPGLTLRTRTTHICERDPCVVCEQPACVEGTTGEDSVETCTGDVYYHVTPQKSLDVTYPSRHLDLPLLQVQYMGEPR